MTKKALIIGINYQGTSSELSGCIADAKAIYSLITSLYTNIQIKFMSELSNNKSLHPTKNNIISHIRWLVSDLKEGDTLFLHYSGHGGNLADSNGEEKDGRDETIVPLDFNRSGQIRDDTLKEELVDKIPEGVQLICIFDSCHSGTVLDLKYRYVQPRAISIQEITNNSEESKGNIVMFSGCKDAEYSWETFDNGKIKGAMTTAFLKAVNNLLFSSNRSISLYNDAIKKYKSSLIKHKKALRRNRRNPRLTRINQQNIAKISKKMRIAVSKILSEKQTMGDTPIQYSTLMKNLLTHINTQQNPQISSGKIIDLDSTFTLM